MSFVPAGTREVSDSARRAAEPSGFTLIGMLVVIAIIGVLMALTFPAVQIFVIRCEL